MKTVIAKFSPIYPNVGLNAVRIVEEIEREEKQFLSTLEKGLKEFAKIANHKLSGKDVFDLFQTYGFPLEMTLELIAERMELSDFDRQSIINEYMVSYEEHQAKSRAGAEQKFKGGLADHSDETTSLHSATHLMLAGLRKYL